MSKIVRNGISYGGTATTANQVIYSPTETVADKLDDLNTTPIALTSLTYSGSFICSGFADLNSRILLYVSYPFLFSSNTYNLSCSKVNIPSTGVFTSGISVDTKYTTGCLIILTTSATVGRSYCGVVDLSFTA